MRLQSHIWVAAFMRREQADGVFAALLRKGSREAGAIFVVQNHLNGNCTVWAPAPQTAFMDADLPAGRLFEKVKDAVAEVEARQWLDRQISFDPDCWIVETERRSGEPDLFV